MILVFLHGKGADKNAYNQQMKRLASYLSADYVSFNAPFCYLEKKDKYLWFNKFEQNNRRDAIKEEYLYSLDYVKKELQKLPVLLSDVVLIGHSQGGGMAVDVGLRLNLKAVFSICGDLPYNLKYISESKTPIYWLEGEDDTYINQERKDSYKILEKLGVDVHYRLVSNCTHMEINSAFGEIEQILKRCENGF